VELNLNVTDDQLEKLKEKCAEVNQAMKGEAYDIVSKVFKALTGKKVTVPNTFKSHGGASAIKCSLKANDGYLYPLEKSFFFIHKPSTLIRHDDINNVEFARVESSTNTSSTRTFDLIVTLKNNNVHQFTGIQRQEYSNLFNFIAETKLKIKTTKGIMDAVDAAKETRNIFGTQTGEKSDQENEESESEEDEDFVAVDEDDIPEEYDSPDEEEAGGDGDGDGDGDGEGSESENKDKKKEKHKDTSNKDSSNKDSKKRKHEEGTGDKDKKKHKKDKKEKKEKREKKEKKEKREKKEKKENREHKEKKQITRQRSQTE